MGGASAAVLFVSATWDAPPESLVADPKSDSKSDSEGKGKGKHGAPAPLALELLCRSCRSAVSAVDLALSTAPLERDVVLCVVDKARGQGRGVPPERGGMRCSAVSAYHSSTDPLPIIHPSPPFPHTRPPSRPRWWTSGFWPIPYITHRPIP